MGERCSAQPGQLPSGGSGARSFVGDLARRLQGSEADVARCKVPEARELEESLAAKANEIVESVRRDGRAVDWTQLDQVTAACAEAIPALAGIIEAAPSAAFRIKGLKLAREPHRYSGRTAMRANQSVHEPRAPQDIDSAFAFSMEGYAGSAEPRQQVAFAWAPGWNSPQAWNKFQDEVGGHLRAGDPGVRLIEAKGQALPWFSVNAAFNPAQGTWQAVPLHHLFGSEETSSRAAPVQERIPQPYVALAKDEADRLGVNDGALLALTVNGQTLRLPLAIKEEMGIGLVGLPAGLPGIPAIFAGAVVTAVQESAQ